MKRNNTKYSKINQSFENLTTYTNHKFLSYVELSRKSEASIKHIKKIDMTGTRHAIQFLLRTLAVQRFFVKMSVFA